MLNLEKSGKIFVLPEQKSMYDERLNAAHQVINESLSSLEGGIVFSKKKTVDERDDATEEAKIRNETIIRENISFSSKYCVLDSYYNQDCIDIGTRISIKRTYGPDDYEIADLILVQQRIANEDPTLFVSLGTPLGDAIYGKIVGCEPIVVSQKINLHGKQESLKFVVEVLEIYANRLGDKINETEIERKR